MIGRLFFLLLFLISISCLSQRSINRYRHKERQGLWIVYQDSTNKQVDNIGRYRRGIPKGTWKYYDADGKLLKKERYRSGKIFITEYHPNGMIRKQGKAKTVTSDKLIHYFYYGNWYVYDTSGTLIKTQLYREGNRIAETNYKTSSEKSINDSLVEVLRQMNTSLLLYADTVLVAEATYGRDSKERQRSISLSNLNALRILDDMEKIIQKFGYPGRSLVGNEYAIAFSIISSASLKYKEKYYDVIVASADKKELDWTDVAFFVDKVKVAKKEKQVYGTQYKIEGDRLMYYPVEDIAGLNSRRKSAGLEEVDAEGWTFLHY
jgi:hypothetical protein